MCDKRIHPGGKPNVCTIFYDSPSNRRLDISIKNKFQTHEELAVKSGVSRINPLGTMKVCAKFQTNPPNSCVKTKVADRLTLLSPKLHRLCGKKRIM